MTDATELASGRRGRRVVAGERMVTPVKPLNLGGEKLLPGRDRLAPQHPAVRERPEWFRPAAPRDVSTARSHSRRLERAARAIRRRLGGTTRATTSTFRLPAGDRETWRLHDYRFQVQRLAPGVSFVHPVRVASITTD